MEFDKKVTKDISSNYKYLYKKLNESIENKGDDAFHTFFYDLGKCYEIDNCKNQRISLTIALLEILVTSIDRKIDQDNPAFSNEIYEIFLPLHVLLAINDLNLNTTKIKKAMIDFPEKFKTEKTEKDIQKLQLIRISDFVLYADVFLSNANISSVEKSKLRHILEVYALIDLYFDDILDYDKDIKNNNPNPFIIKKNVDYHLDILVKEVNNITLDIKNQKAVKFLRNEVVRYINIIQNQIEMSVR